MPKNQAEYSHHPFVIPKKDLHGQLGQSTARGTGRRATNGQALTKSVNLLSTVPRNLYRGGKKIGKPYDSRHDAVL